MTLLLATLPDPALFARGPVARLMAALGGEGEEIRVAGGAVRNVLLGLAPSDIDCVTTTLPDETMRRAEKAGFRVIPSGYEHGTVTVIVEDRPFEVTTLRADVETDGRRARVRFGRDFAADAERRDFTINALFADAQGRIYDHVGGLADLAQRRVRFIGEAQTRIREDYLRILRLFRFHAQYGDGDIDADALIACIRLRDGLDILSRERVRAEMMKLLVAPRAAETLRIMDETGFLTRIFGGVGNLMRYARAPNDSGAALRLALIGVECLEDAARLRARLSLSNEETALLENAARLSEALRARRFSPSFHEMRRLIHRDGGSSAEAMAAILEAAGAAPDIVATARDVRGWRPPPLPWRGRDAIEAGVAPGPAVGELLARAETLWIEADFPDDAVTLAVIWDRAKGGS